MPLLAWNRGETLCAALGAILDEVDQQLLHPGAVQREPARLAPPVQGEGDVERRQHLLQQGAQLRHQGGQVARREAGRALCSLALSRLTVWVMRWTWRPICSRA